MPRSAVSPRMNKDYKVIGTTPRPRLDAEAKARKAIADARAAKAHDRYVSRTYGLEPGEYARLLAEQDGRCAICTKRPRNRRLAVDHDHRTGKVRGLLCYFCNHFVIGTVEFDPIAAHNAAVYLSNIAADFDIGFDPLSSALVEPSVEHLLPKQPLPDIEHNGPDLPF